MYLYIDVIIKNCYKAILPELEMIESRIEE